MKKKTPKPESRDEKARRELKESKEERYGQKVARATKKNEYIRGLINGRYFLARCNMMATQILNKAIVEHIDGCVKSEEYMRAEYAHQKMQAIVSLRASHFAKKDLMNIFKLSETDLFDLERDYYDGKIIREDYDEEYRRKHKAEFVNSPED